MKNIIFDFGWVIVRFDEEYMTRCYVEDESDCKLVKDVVFDRLYWDRFDDGSLSFSEAKQMMKDRLPENLYDSAMLVLDNWYRHLNYVDGMRELIIELKNKGKNLYLLSNIGVDFSQNYNTVPELRELFSLFDGLVFSGDLHIVKPSKEIFEYLLDKYSLKAEDCVFIDDKQINIDGAQKAGIKGVLFGGSAESLYKQIL